MSKLRKSARGRGCQIRLEGICNFNPETVVLCHIGGAGMGKKSNDIHASFGCSSCHDEVDRRTRKTQADHARLALLEGVIRTQLIWLDEGLIKCTN